MYKKQLKKYISVKWSTFWWEWHFNNGSFCNFLRDWNPQHKNLRECVQTDGQAGNPEHVITLGVVGRSGHTFNIKLEPQLLLQSPCQGTRLLLLVLKYKDFNFSAWHWTVCLTTPPPVITILYGWQGSGSHPHRSSISTVTSSMILNSVTAQLSRLSSECSWILTWWTSSPFPTMSYADGRWVSRRTIVL